MAKWQAWAAGIGDAWVSPGNPFGKAKTVSASAVSDDARSDRCTGFSIAKPASLMAVVKLVKGGPTLTSAQSMSQKRWKWECSLNEKSAVRNRPGHSGLRRGGRTDRE